MRTLFCLASIACASAIERAPVPPLEVCETYDAPASATRSDGAWWVLQPHESRSPTHHMGHERLFGDGVDGINLLVLRAVDDVQQRAPDGGGYFIGISAEPTESPVGQPLQMYGRSMLSPTRSSSYCTGATYAALLGAVERAVPEGLDEVRLEALRLQEPDGSRREDERSVWGWWNADGAGGELALVQLVGAGVLVDQIDARPGDFVNISWRGGRGHSAVFLGWTFSEGQPAMRYWSSNPGTDGYGDQTSLLSDMDALVVVRLRRPAAFKSFQPEGAVRRRGVAYPPLWRCQTPLRTCEVG
ncbi:MAG: hypothetical protein ACI9MC_002521 [Kiritimatiellia bacterium]|jgi:hypothetical protein